MAVLWVSHHLFHSERFKNLYPSESARDYLIGFLVFCSFLGAKLGYVFFYSPWAGYSRALLSLQGFSFHGGILGLMIGLGAVARSSKNFFLLSDEIVLNLPVGIFLGRIGNFFNSELLGRPWDHPYAIGFPFGETLVIPRHPSQLYEAFGEGLLLGVLLHALSGMHPKFFSKTGAKSSFFLIAYGLIRFLLEQFRSPDPQIGYLFERWTLGQILCMALVLLGLWTFIFSWLNRTCYENLS